MNAQLQMAFGLVEARAYSNQDRALLRELQLSREASRRARRRQRRLSR